MKKFLLIALALSILMSFSACGNSEIDNRVNLPIKGHFSVKGDIIVETDKISVTDDVIPNAEAFTYKDGEFYKLKRYETEITIPKKYTIYDELYGKYQTLPLQYYFCNGMVYAYLNTNEKGFSLLNIQIFSIPGNEEYVIIQGMYIIPLYVNLKSGKFKSIFEKSDQDLDTTLRVTCISEDGKYLALFGTTLEKFEQGIYIINLKNFKTTKISMPKYNSSHKLKTFYPIFFADGRLYINYALTPTNNIDQAKLGTFYYDLNNKKLKEFSASLSDYIHNENRPYIRIKFENETGTVRIINFKDNLDYSFSVYPSNGLWGSPNKTGQYFIGSYFDMPLAGYDENGQPYYENVQQNQKYIVVDVKNQKRIDLSKIDDKFNYKTYDGKSCGYSWISETELIIFCQDGNEEYIQTVINVDEV